MADGDRPVVLVVEDEPDVAETYELWLAGDYEVRRAENGSDALAIVGDDVDVVLLDRMMPGMAGEDVLAEIRDRGLDVRVAMVTAVDPDFDIIEMGFDAYVTKPPTRDEIEGVVADLLHRDEYADRLREYHALVDKRAALREEKSDSALAESEAFADLEARIAELEEAVDADNERLLDDAEFVATLRDVTGDDPTDADGAGEDAADHWPADGEGDWPDDDAENDRPDDDAGDDGSTEEGPTGGGADGS